MTDVVAEPGKLELGPVIRETFGVLGRNFTSFAVLALILVGVPSLILGYLQLQQAQSGALVPFSPLGLAAGLIGISTSAVLQGALIYGTVHDLNGRRAVVSDVLSTGLRSFLPLIGLAILSTLGIGLGFILLVVPGFMLLCAWIVATPALVAEKRDVFSCFGRSAELTRGNRWRIFGLLVLYGIVTMVVGLVIAGLMGAALLGGGSVAVLTLVVQVISNTLISLVGATGVAVLYVELRRAREGLGAESLAEVFA